MKDTIVDVLENVFGKEQSTYVVKNRVPLLCQAVVDIKATIIEVKELIMDNRRDSDEQHKSFVTKDGQYFLVRAIVFGGTTIVLAGMLKLVFDSVTK